MLVKVLLALTVIIITARLMGMLFKRLDQPPVIGEVAEEGAEEFVCVGFAPLGDGRAIRVRVCGLHR